MPVRPTGPAKDQALPDAAARRDHRPLRRARPGRPRRHGRGLRGVRSRAGSQGRGQAAAGQARQRRLPPRGAAAHAARGAGDRAAVAPERRRRLRRRARSRSRCSSRWSSSRGTPSPTGCRPQPRSWQEILKVFMAAGRGLAAAHEKGLVHRDFKPDNVMVGRDNQVRVMDFGLARQVTEKSGDRRQGGERRQVGPVAASERSGHGERRTRLDARRAGARRRWRTATRSPT